MPGYLGKTCTKAFRAGSGGRDGGIDGRDAGRDGPAPEAGLGGADGADARTSADGRIDGRDMGRDGRDMGRDGPGGWPPPPPSTDRTASDGTGGRVASSEFLRITSCHVCEAYVSEGMAECSSCEADLFHKCTSCSSLNPAVTPPPTPTYWSESTLSS